ncbi:hypothetical protein, partial [Winogradskyella sp.]|uniref:hypothetical protein n=1 Tax=Winogradskyella sp. TaxID=1883156 RepID=UPI003F6993E3
KMTEDDKAALKEFMRGVAFTIGLTGIIILGIAILSNNDVPELKPTAEVVDTYKGCDIVRWNAHGLAEYKYFLHCNNTRPIYEQ